MMIERMSFPARPVERVSNQGNLLKGIVIWFVRREGIEYLLFSVQLRHYEKATEFEKISHLF